jgi:DMSO/TMAO reductase YedYZ molybdopterin-dependent catalytic subunit
VRRLSRRQFLEIAVGASLAACTTPAAQVTSTPAFPVAAPTPTTIKSPSAESSPAATLPVYPAPPRPPLEIQVTSNDSLYTQSYKTVPQVDAASWKLSIDGLVKHPMTLDLAGITARPAHEIMRTLECIGNPVGGPLIGNVVWTGTRLRPLLDEAGVLPSAAYIKFTSADGYQTAVDLKYFQDDLAFLAYKMNRQPLPDKHGFPMRLFFSGSYGQKMPKWITRVELIDHEFEGYWERHGWSDGAQVRTNSIILQPRTGATYAAQAMSIWGIAYAGKRRIVRVEVKLGDAGWASADLLPSPDEDVWTQWKLPWQPVPGNYKIQVRATDSNGLIQERVASGPLDSFPNGTESLHQIYVNIIAG